MRITLMAHATIAFISILGILFILSCGEEGLIDPHGKVDIPPPSSEGFQAVDFPTNNGSAWTYVNVATGKEFTLRIEEIRDVGGITHRQMTVSEISPAQPDSINREPVDHLSANKLYFRLDADFFQSLRIPIFATYFLKTPQSYIESAFDAYLPVPANPVRHQKHFPPRLIWDFPLQVGKQWTVFEKTTSPSTHVTRRVINANVSVTVPSGGYDAFLVEEEIVGLSQKEAFTLVGDPPRLELARYEPAKYWVVPNVGVVKYQYAYFRTATVNQSAIELLLAATFELRSSDLPDASLR